MKIYCNILHATTSASNSQFLYAGISIFCIVHCRPLLPYGGLQVWDFWFPQILLISPACIRLLPWPYRLLSFVNKVKICLEDKWAQMNSKQTEPSYDKLDLCISKLLFLSQVFELLPRFNDLFCKVFGHFHFLVAFLTCFDYFVSVCVKLFTVRQWSCWCGQCTQLVVA